MRLVVNGKPTELAEGARVTDLLAQLGLAERPSAVEVNKDLVPRRRHGEHVLAEGDTVEIVTLVGGG